MAGVSSGTFGEWGGELGEELGVQSWCFRHFRDPDALIAQIKLLGLTRLELCASHADFENEAGFERIIEKYRTAGIAITSIGVQTFKADEATEAKWFRFCKLAGATVITANIDVSSLPQGIEVTQKLAEQHGIKVALHNHGGYHWLGNVQMLTHILKHTSPAIGLCMDSAWCMQTGDCPLKWIEQFAEKLYAVHIKDFTFDRAGKWTDVVVGTGNLKLREFMTAARKAPGHPILTLEYEGDVENPCPKLRECVEHIAAAR